MMKRLHVFKINKNQIFCTSFVFSAEWKHTKQWPELNTKPWILCTVTLPVFIAAKTFDFWHVSNFFRLDSWHLAAGCHWTALGKRLHHIRQWIPLCVLCSSVSSPVIVTHSQKKFNIKSHITGNHHANIILCLLKLCEMHRDRIHWQYLGKRKRDILSQ